MIGDQSPFRPVGHGRVAGMKYDSPVVPPPLFFGSLVRAGRNPPSRDSPGHPPPNTVTDPSVCVAGEAGEKTNIIIICGDSGRGEMHRIIERVRVQVSDRHCSS